MGGCLQMVIALSFRRHEMWRICYINQAQWDHIVQRKVLDSNCS